MTYYDVSVHVRVSVTLRNLSIVTIKSSRSKLGFINIVTDELQLVVFNKFERASFVITVSLNTVMYQTFCFATTSIFWLKLAAN